MHTNQRRRTQFDHKIKRRRTTTSPNHPSYPIRFPTCMPGRLKDESYDCFFNSHVESRVYLITSDFFFKQVLASKSRAKKRVDLKKSATVRVVGISPGADFSGSTMNFLGGGGRRSAEISAVSIAVAGSRRFLENARPSFARTTLYVHARASAAAGAH